jgi:hypothetical protein
VPVVLDQKVPPASRATVKFDVTGSDMVIRVSVATNVGVIATWPAKIT